MKEETSQLLPQNYKGLRKITMNNERTKKLDKLEKLINSLKHRTFQD